MKTKFSLFMVLFAFSSLFAQHSATITVTDATTSPIAGATVRLNGTNVTTDANGKAVFPGLADGNYVYSVTKTCYVSIPSGGASVTVAGADVTATASLKTIDNTVTRKGNVLTAATNTGLTGLTYQWVDCNNSNAPVTGGSGGTTKIYTAPATAGNYAVVITNSACSTTATSLCTAVPVTYSATITITDPASQPVTGASVVLNGTTVATGANGQAVFTGLEAGQYIYTVTKSCFANGTGAVTVASGNVTDTKALVNAVIDNTVTRKGNLLTATASGTGVTYQWYDCANPTIPIVGATTITYAAPAAGGSFQVKIANSTCTNEVPVTSACTTVPVTYSATITVNNNQNTALQGASVTLNSVTVATGANGLAVFTGLEDTVTYNYTIAAPSTSCYANTTGSVTIAAANATATIFLALKTANDVNVLLSQFGSNPLGYTIELTGQGYDQTITSGNALGDIFPAVPFGVYAYIISKPCNQTITGAITVTCNNGNPNAISVTPVQVDNTVLHQGNVLTSNASGVGTTYQWLDCNKANAPIAGATSQTYTATVNGSYSVMVTNSCSNTATSVCVLVNTLGLDDNKIDTFSVYPNPVSNELSIALNNSSQKVIVEVVNMQGQVVLRTNFSDIKNAKLDVSALSTGLYILNVNADNVFSSRKIMKK